MKSYKDFLNELVQQDFFQKNPGFYLNKGKPAEEGSFDESREKIENLLKNIKVDDIEVDIEKIPEHGEELRNGSFLPPPEYININLNYSPEPKLAGRYKQNDSYFRYYYNKNTLSMYKEKYMYKLILAVIKKLNLTNYSFLCSRDWRENINEIFKNIVFYGLYFKHKDDYYYELYLTKNTQEYVDKIKYCRKKKLKIIYYNNNVKGGRDLFDFEGMKNQDLSNRFKKISDSDIYFKKDENSYTYRPHFKNKQLDNFFFKLSGKSRLSLGLTGDAQMEGNLFGKKVGHRYHMSGGLPDSLKNIGLGYKLYKSFIKFVGYLCSNTQTSTSVRNVYNKLLQDKDFYTIIDNDGYNGKIMLIDKNYKDIPTLIQLVKEREAKERKRFIYDKELNQYLYDFDWQKYKK
jgi:hypothetical protein